MSAGGITQGSYGFVKINGTVVLIRAGASLAMPINPDMPQPLSGGGPLGIVNYAEGLMFPVVNIPAIPTDNGAADWLTAANLNAWFITRSAAPVGDLAELTSLYYSNNGSIGNGRGTFRVNKAKGAGFSLVCRKGQGIGMNLRFAGRNLANGLTGDRPTAPKEGVPIQFDKVVLGTEMADKGIVGFTLQFDTALTPNMELDGTKWPVEQNAGIPTCSISIEYNSLDTVLPLGYDGSIGWEAVDDVDFGIITDDATPTTLTFTMSRLKIRNPLDRQSQIARVQNTFTYDVIGTGATKAYPLAIA